MLTRRLLLAAMLVRDVHASLFDDTADELLIVAKLLEHEAHRLSPGIDLAVSDGTDMHKITMAIRRLAVALDPEIDGRDDHLTPIPRDAAD